MEFTYNNTIYTSTRKSALYAQGDKKVAPILQTKDNIFEVDQYMESMEEAPSQRSQAKQRKAADRHHRALEFNEDDHVLLHNLEGHAQQSVGQR